MFSPKLIVVPIEFSNFSQEALQASADLARGYDAEILLVDVVPAIPRLTATAEVFHEADYEAALHKEAEDGLEKLAEELRQSGQNVRTAVGVANDTATEIVRIAEHNNADLIVMATHGKSGWHKFMVGSVTEKVVRNADCPVLVLRAAHATEHEQADKSRGATA